MSGTVGLREAHEKLEKLRAELATDKEACADRNGKALDTKLLEPIARQLNMP